MKKRFTESQIIAAIKKRNRGIPVKESCRETGISEKKIDRKVVTGDKTPNQLDRFLELSRAATLFLYQHKELCTCNFEFINK